ncbi:phage tail length tape measure family protein [Variovorax paradoxus]|nr:phage tail length tape measure family protein [Variovorax paradoxus]
MDAVTLSLAVDSTQVNSAAAALDKMAASGGKAETVSVLLTRASTTQAQVLGGALAPAAGKAAASVGELATASKAIGTTSTTGINSASTALSNEAAQAGKAALAFKTLAAAQAALGPGAARQLAAASADLGAIEKQAKGAGAAIAAVGTGTARASGLSALTAEATKAKASVVDLSGATTSLGAASFDKVTSSLKATSVAALEAARNMIALRDAEAQAQARTGSLATVTTSPGAGGAASFAQVSDASAINALATAAARADAQANALGRTLSREVASGATRAKSSINDLSKATTSLGASTFANFDQVTTSLGAASTKAQEATRDVNALAAAIDRVGPLANVGTSLGARQGPAVQTGGLRAAIANAEANDAGNRNALAQRLAGNAAVPNAAPITAAGTAAGKAAGQFDAMGKSAKLAAFQQQQLGFQLHDFFVQVASGQSPLTAFVQQGSQLSGTLGGAGNAFRAVTALITPMRAAIIGAVASVGALAVALAHAESAARDLNTLQAQLAGTGRSGLFSTAELREFIQQLALAPGVTRDTATAIVSELSKVHDIGGPLFRDLAAAAVDYAKATGTDVPTAAKALAKAFADPERGAKQLDDALGTLTSSQLLTIERMTRMGNVAGAQRVLFDALQNSIKGLNDNAVTPLQRSTNELGNAWEKAMQSLDKSQGLQTLNSLLAKTVGLVTFLMQNADKIGGLGNIGVSMIPGVGLPTAAINAVKAQFGSGEAPKNNNPTAFGRITGGPIAAGGGASQTLAGAAQGNDDSIKHALKAGESFQSQAGKIGELTQQRKAFNVALGQAVDLYGKGSEQAKKLRDAIAGVDERIASAQQKGAGEAGQVARAALAQDLKGFQDALEQEREGLQFHNRFMSGEFQAGNVSAKSFFEDRRASIAAAVDAEIATLEKERARLEQYKRETKDPSEKVQAQTRINEIGAQEGKLRRQGANETALANQDAAESFKRLDEQVLNYRASLKELEGDEVGAAKIRAQISATQLSVLARQTEGRPGAITAEDQSRADRINQNVITVNEAKRQTSIINERLAIEEERIALSQQTGALSENAALVAQGEARRKVVGLLQEQLAAMEKIGAESKNPELLLNIERTRLELDKLKAALDPLKDKFDNMFKDAGANAIGDFLNRTKTAKEAAKDFFNSITTTINNNVAKELSDSLFGKGGIFGDAGGLLAGVFGGKKAGATPTLDTSAVTQSLSSLKATGVDPATTALTKLAQAADAAAGSVGKSGGAGGVGGLLSNDAATTLANNQPGDPLDNLIRNQGGFGTIPKGEQSVFDLFKAADTASADSARTTADFGKSVASAGADVLKLAASAGQGGSALGLLPSIVSAISAATATSSASGGGGLGGIFSSLFGSGGYSAADQAGLDALVATFHTGGIVGGPAAMKSASPSVFAGAAKYHGGGKVLGSQALGLNSNEVPAILLRNEEVLTERDPRHRDNIAPALLKHIEGGSTVLNVIANAGAGGSGGDGGYGAGGDVTAVGGSAWAWGASSAAPSASPVARLLTHDRQTREMSPLTRYLMGSPATVSSLISELSREADFESVTKLRELHVAGNREFGGPVSAGGLYRVNERGPEMLQVAGKQYLMLGKQGGTVTPNPGGAQGGRGGGETNLHVSVTPPAGTDRASALHWGTTAGRQIQRAQMRNN